MNCIKQEFRRMEERDGELINIVLEYAIRNGMSQKEIDDCINKVKEVFYTDGLIKRN